MEKAREVARAALGSNPQDEFIVDLGKDNHTAMRVWAAFEEFGCTLERSDDRCGKVVVRRQAGQQPQ